MGTWLPVPLASAKLRPIEFHEARLSRGSSSLLIAVLSDASCSKRIRHFLCGVRHLETIREVGIQVE